MRRFEGILFDFFGTLVEYSASRTEQDFSRTLELVRQAGMSLDMSGFLKHWVAASEHLDTLAAVEGREYAMAEVGAAFLEQAGYPADADLAARLGNSYVADWAGAISPIHGVDQLLARLSRDYQLGVITNTHHPPMVHEWLSRIGIADKLQSVTTSLDHGVPKPAASIFTEALSAGGLEADRTLYVGDSYAADYRGATGAGLTCILVGRHARVPREYCIPSVLDLPRVLAWL